MVGSLENIRLFLASSLDETALSICKHLKKTDLEKGLFITTASEVEEGAGPYIEKDRQRLLQAGFSLESYSCTGKSRQQVTKAVTEASAIIVEGGNTFFLLSQLRKSGAVKIIRDAVLGGKPYLGSSAGSLVAGHHIETAKRFDDLSQAPDLKSFEGMQLVDLVVECHWGNTKIPDNKKKSLEALAELFDRDEKFVLLRDNQYLCVTGSSYRVVSTN